MARWIWRFALRFAVFFVGVAGFCQALSFVLGADDEVRTIAREYRGLTLIGLSLMAIVFAMYDWMDRNEP